MLPQATRTAGIAVPQHLYRHVSHRIRSRPPSFPECQPVLWRQHRKMITHRSQPLQSSSILSDTLSRGGSGGSSSGVGPFQLGIRPNDYGRGEPVKKWKELSASGKGARHWPRIGQQLKFGSIVARATAQTSSLFVILLGGGLAALIVYALATEMGSSNSPTVLYSDACERIKRSQAVGSRIFSVLHFIDR